MEQNIAPDFGLFLRNEDASITKYIFFPFYIFSIDRINNGEYSTTSNYQYRNIKYAVTVDFSEKVYQELLGIISPNIAYSLRKIFGKNNNETRMVDLPMPIIIGIETKPGKIITNSDEQFIPFIATKVFEYHN